MGLNPKARLMLEAFNPKTYEEALRTAKALEEPPKEKNLEPTVFIEKKRPVEVGPTEFQPPLQRPRHQNRPPVARYLVPEKPLCRNCGKQHGGKCLVGFGVCYNCGRAGHVARACPARGTGNPREPLRGPVI